MVELGRGRRRRRHMCRSGCSARRR